MFTFTRDLIEINIGNRTLRYFAIQPVDPNGQIAPPLKAIPAPNTAVVLGRPGADPNRISDEDCGGYETHFLQEPFWVPPSWPFLGRFARTYLGTVSLAPLWLDPPIFKTSAADGLQVGIDVRLRIRIFNPAKYLLRLYGNEATAVYEVLSTALNRETSNYSGIELITLAGDEGKAMATFARLLAIKNLAERDKNNRPTTLEIIKEAKDVETEYGALKPETGKLSMDALNKACLLAFDAEFTDKFGIVVEQVAVQGITPPPEVAQAESQRAKARIDREAASDRQQEFKQEADAFDGASWEKIAGVGIMNALKVLQEILGGKSRGGSNQGGGGSNKAKAAATKKNET